MRQPRTAAVHLSAGAAREVGASLSQLASAVKAVSSEQHMTEHAYAHHRHEKPENLEQQTQQTSEVAYAHHVHEKPVSIVQQTAQVAYVHHVHEKVPVVQPVSEQHMDTEQSAVHDEDMANDQCANDGDVTIEETAVHDDDMGNDQCANDDDVDTEQATVDDEAAPRHYMDALQELTSQHTQKPHTESDTDSSVCGMREQFLANFERSRGSKGDIHIAAGSRRKKAKPLTPSTKSPTPEAGSVSYVAKLY